MKTAYEAIVLPFTIRVVKTTKKIEGEDVYDNNTNFSIWKINNI